MRKPQIIIGILLVIVLLVLGACAPAPLLTTPRLVTPHNGATDVELSPTLLWQPVPNAGGYELTISLDYDFSSIVHDVSTRLVAYQITEDLTPSTRYYWMVCAKLNPADPDTPVAYSEVWTFTTVD